MKSKSAKVTAVGIAFNDDGPGEHAETTKLWSMMRMPPTGEVANKFAALTDDSETDRDEDDVVKAISALTPNVKRASKRISQRNARKSKSMNLAHLNAIARKVKSGEIQLPDMDLTDNDEFEYIWCMVDSGAGANVARREHLPHSKKTNAPRISLTVANGETMPNRGARSTECYDKSGTRTTRVFYEAQVEMPILSVTEITKEGTLGSEVRFRRNDGMIVDNSTGRTSEFVKRMGVYFMRIYFPKVQGRSTEGFVRPEP